MAKGPATVSRGLGLGGGEATAVVRAPGYTRWITDPAKLARAVVMTITRAMSQAALAGR